MVHARRHHVGLFRPGRSHRIRFSVAHPGWQGSGPACSALESYPVLGTPAGVLVLFGTTRALVARFKKPEKYSSHSLLSDWLFLWLLPVAVGTGFIVEVALYLPHGAVWGYVVFLVHVIVGMEIVLLFPFTKFAHAVYRPIALLAQELATSQSPSHDERIAA